MQCIDIHVVTSDEAGMPLRDCAAAVFRHLPKKGVRKRIRAGTIRLNGQVVPSNATVQCADEISLWQRVDNSPPFDYPLSILYEDTALAVINKPAGLLVSGNAHRTVQRALRSAITPPSVNDALQVARPVHRLDKETSGVLVVARTVGALRSLSQQFADRRVVKTYVAVVAGELTGKGNLDASLDGKIATTDYQVLDSSPGPSGAPATRVLVRPHTGRTHQIRRHLAGLGHPIIGDPLYGPATAGKERLLLHAWKIRMEHPLDGSGLQVEAPLPEGFGRYD